MKSKQNIILEEIYLNNKSQKEIADNLDISESYVSQIASKAKMLRIPLKIVDDKLVCTKCEKENDNLMFHHNHSTGEYIALVCRSCNVKFRANNDFDYAEPSLFYPNTVHSKISEETNQKLIKVALVKKITISELIRKILEEYTT